MNTVSLFCSSIKFQEEYSDIYSSICELRDRSSDLQQEIEEREKRGDTSGADRIRQELSATEAKLLEKNEERKVRYGNHLENFRQVPLDLE